MIRLREGLKTPRPPDSWVEDVISNFENFDLNLFESASKDMTPKDWLKVKSLVKKYLDIGPPREEDNPELRKSREGRREMVVKELRSFVKEIIERPLLWRN